MTQLSAAPVPSVAYLADGKLYLKQHGQPARLIESPFVQAILDRAGKARQRNEWKQQGMAWQFAARPTMPLGLGGAGTPPAEMRRVRFSGVCAAPPLVAGNPPANADAPASPSPAAAAELLYTLDTDYVGGLFSFDLADQTERRLFHRNQFRAGDVARHPGDGMLALSLAAPDGSSNICTLRAGGGGGIREVTEGDSVDEAPSWVAGRRQNALVFQSAGIARNAAGQRVALGPYVVQRLDLSTGDLSTVYEDERFDLLVPRIAEDGSLYAVRRPYEPGAAFVSSWRIAGDVLLFPIRLARAVVAFLNLFSLFFSRKPLITSGGPPREGPDERQLMLWGRMIDAEKALRRQKGDSAPSLVPSTWELIRRSPAGEETVLARGVLSFDLSSDNSVVYTDGSAVYHLPAPGATPTELFRGKMIERVAVT